jgi:hypothetical protein
MRHALDEALKLLPGNAVCTENLIRVDAVTGSSKLAG